MARVLAIFRILVVSSVALALTLAAAWSPRATAAPAAPVVYVASLQGEVDPITARYLHNALAEANSARAAAFVLTIDTPGGLDTSMRQMVQDMLASGVPTIAYVSPAGSRDASAGVFITEAANVVAMAPGTNIGAAHPVDSGGNNIQSDMRDKVTNDAAAYIASIAKQRGRNTQWVQDAVRNSVSLDAQQAVDQNVADLLASSVPELLGAVDGRAVTTTGGAATLRTRGAVVQAVPMNWWEDVLQKIADPNVAYALFTIGFYALLIELFHPGALVPGVAGTVSIVLALVAFSTLPINWGGAILIVAAIVLFVLDVKAATHGALTIAGLVCFVLGSLLLYNPPGARSPSQPAVSLSPLLLVVTTAAIAALCTLVVGAAVRTARRGPVTGVQLVIGGEGVASSALEPKGTVRVAGQLWSAELHGAGRLEAGQAVRVLGRRGLTLDVEPTSSAPGPLTR